MFEEKNQHVCFTVSWLLNWTVIGRNLWSLYWLWKLLTPPQPHTSVRHVTVSLPWIQTDVETDGVSGDAVAFFSLSSWNATPTRSSVCALLFNGSSAGWIGTFSNVVKNSRIDTSEPQQTRREDLGRRGVKLTLWSGKLRTFTEQKGFSSRRKTVWWFVIVPLNDTVKVSFWALIVTPFLNTIYLLMAKIIRLNNKTLMQESESCNDVIYNSKTVTGNILLHWVLLLFSLRCKEFLDPDRNDSFL